MGYFCFNLGNESNYAYALPFCGEQRWEPLWARVLLVNLEPFLTSVQCSTINLSNSSSYPTTDKDDQSEYRSSSLCSTASYLEEKCSPPLIKSQEAASRRITASAQADHRLSLRFKKLYLVVTAHRSFFKVSLHTA